MKRQHPAPTCDDFLSRSDESGRARDPDFLSFREMILAKAFRRTKMLRARKLNTRVAGGQKSFSLYGQPKSKIAAKSQETGGKRHSKDGASE